ncbi:MAG: hypothetical protein ACYSPI_05865 [Planctomycetota bacterium]|jgi:hypothetical protein
MNDDIKHIELDGEIQEYDAYADPQKRLQTDRAVRDHLYRKLIWCRSAAERILCKLLDEGLLEDTDLLELMIRRLLRMAVSIKSRSYDSCSIFKDPSLAEKTLQELRSSDCRCVDIVHELPRFIRSFRRTVLSCKEQEGEMREQYINEMMYSDFYFDEITGDLDAEVTKRDFLIMNAEKKLAVTGGP